MQVTFQLKEGDSYQPQLNVVGLVDDSDEVKDIHFLSAISMPMDPGQKNRIPLV